MGTSTHNSQVIHAGHVLPGRLAQGEALRATARGCSTSSAPAIGVPHSRCGKLIVAQNEDEMAELDAIRPRARPTASKGCGWSIARFVAAREPHVRAQAALFSPNTGILSAEGLVQALARQLPRRRRRSCCRARRCVGADVGADAITLRTPAETIQARVVVNAAGLFADDVSAMLGGEPFRIHPCRGEYVELAPAKRALVNGAGVSAAARARPQPGRAPHQDHLRQRHAGTRPCGSRSARTTTRTTATRWRTILAPARELLPELTLDDLRLGGSGIRAKLHPPEESFADFLIGRDARSPRLVQVAGIESPGLTSCLSIAEDVADLVEQSL